MKKLIAISIISSIGLTSFLANAAENEKNGIYVSGKIGASIVQLSGQNISISSIDEHAEYNGGSHRGGVFVESLALGYDFSTKFGLPIRTELDLTARGNSKSKYNILQQNNQDGIHSGDAKNKVKLNTLMINSFYDFKNESSFTPYLSLGFGYANVDQKTTVSNSYSDNLHAENNYYESASRSNTSNNFAWSIGAGIKYAINNNLDLDFSYRYLDAGKASVSYKDEEYKVESKVKVKTNDLMLGVSYKF